MLIAYRLRSTAAPIRSWTGARSILTTGLHFGTPSATAANDAEAEGGVTHHDAYKLGTPFAAVAGADSASTSASTDDSNASTTKRTYSVLPHRTNLTSRLWLDRFDRNNSEYKRLIESGTSAESAQPAPRSPATFKPRKLVLKHMRDSYVSEQLPFATNPHVREEYVSFYGGIRIAKLLEDLDAMAGSISYTHCDDETPETPPLTIVTASVDRIDLLRRPTLNQDINISGMVTYVGHSSMEITINVEGKNTDNGGVVDPILRARFTMVARDPITNKAVQVNPLVLENDAEKKLFAMGAELKASKKLASTQSLTKAPPTPEERLVIHDLWLQSKKYDQGNLPDHLVWMEDTKVHSLHITQPQDRNIHNFIFGGYLMRQAFEIAHATASLYSKNHPIFLAMDDIWFRKPVPIGSILALTSQVVYSRAHKDKGGSFQVKVTADIRDPITGTSETSNTFNYTFAVPSTDSKRPPAIMPRTYGDAVEYLDGKRRLELGLEMARENSSQLLELW
ncbi:HotDog domain-containing protein [Blastocladiella britannica]|nr:HotDog domain-containing protein [Blastocladiella britannica]